MLAVIVLVILGASGVFGATVDVNPGGEPDAVGPLPVASDYLFWVAFSTVQLQIIDGEYDVLGVTCGPVTWPPPGRLGVAGPCAPYLLASLGSLCYSLFANEPYAITQFNDTIYGSAGAACTDLPTLVAGPMVLVPLYSANVSGLVLHDTLTIAPGPASVTLYPNLTIDVPGGVAVRIAPTALPAPGSYADVTVNATTLGGVANVTIDNAVGGPFALNVDGIIALTVQNLTNVTVRGLDPAIASGVYVLAPVNSLVWNVCGEGNGSNTCPTSQAYATDGDPAGLLAMYSVFAVSAVFALWQCVRYIRSTRQAHRALAYRHVHGRHPAHHDAASAHAKPKAS